MRCLRRSAPCSAGQQASSDGVSVGFRGQIGRRSAWAHAIAHNIEFQPGDVLVTETSAPIWGYNAELERTLIIGPPSDEARRLSTTWSPRRRWRWDSFRPGVDLRRRRPNRARVLRGERSGCPIGGSTRATPGLRTMSLRSSTSATTRPSSLAWCSRLSPVCTSSTVGGFRHSDTVVVTADGIEVLTNYPKDIASLTLEL